MRTLLILIDFDNCRSRRLEQAISRGSPTLKDYEDTFSMIESGVLSTIPLDPGVVAEFQFRFYGGWSSSANGDETELCSMLTKIIAHRPRRASRNVRLSFELARSPLFLPEMRFEETRRDRPWEGDGIKIDTLFQCGRASAGDCTSIASLKSWLKGRCPESGCSVGLDAFAWKRGQKLVDTHIVADTIVAAGSRKWEHVVVVSKDDDMIPGLVFRRTEICELSLIRMQYRALHGRYDQLLKSLHVGIYDVR